MAKSNSKLKAVSKEARKPPPDSKRLIERVSCQGITLDHIKRATGHIRELAMMLYEVQDGGQRCANVARAVQDLMETYADEIDDCVKYLTPLVQDASAIGEAVSHER